MYSQGSVIAHSASRSRYMASINDDVRLPFSTLDSIIGDVFSVHWEPEMMNELGNALKILTAEVLSSVGQSLVGATVMMGGLMSGIAIPVGESLIPLRVHRHIPC